MSEAKSAEKVKRLRERLGLTQVALAERLGVSFPTVNRWENGKSEPSQLSLQRLYELAGEDQASETQEPEPPPYAQGVPPQLDFTAQPRIIRALAEGERLSFGHLANPVFATEISSIDPLPHQRIAVYDHMLRQSRLRFLEADDAGAGKTIMTGLYIREMLSRRLLKRVLIVAPAGLVGNWQRELASLFSLEFRILRGQDARPGNPFLDADRAIISIDTLASKRVYRRLQEPEVEPYDLVVFDEAHKLSCDRGKDFRVIKRTRYRLAEAIAGAGPVAPKWELPWHAHHLLLLTATPHMGKDYPYYALWRLLDPKVFSTPQALTQFPADQKQQYFIRRTKEEMVRLSGEPLYPVRISDTLTYELSQGDVSEQSLYDKTTEYLKYVYNQAQVLNQSAARLAMGVFQRRLASSTYALLCSFERRLTKLDQIIDDVQSGRISFEQVLAMQAQSRDSDDVFDAKSADEEDTEDGREENQGAEEKIIQGIIAATLGDLVAEKEEVLKLRNLARQVYEAGGEAKFAKLSEITTDPRFVNEKLIVFTEHRDTLDFIVHRLEGMGHTGKIAQIHGGMPYTERDEQVERFRLPIEEGGARFLICTDAAGEGINLQFCWLMINYDIPWNPARLEQRMGRIHRYGQTHDPVIILNLVAPKTREGKVLHTLLQKLEKIRKELKSDKVFDSIGRVFGDVSIKKYMEMALAEDADIAAKELDGQLTKEQVQAIADRERRLFGDGGDVAKELPRLRESLEQETYFRLLPGYIRSFVEVASPQVGIGIEGDPGGLFTFQGQKPASIDPLLAAIETYPARQREQLSIERPKDRRSCIWVHPGEPVFEAFRELVRQKLGRDALRGAVFVDPTAAEPYLFHLARVSIIRLADPDIEELSGDDTIECRLVGVRQTQNAETELCPVEHLLLLRGGNGLPAKAQRLAVIAQDHRERAKAYLIERVARKLAVEHREKLLSTLDERESFVRRGFDFQEAELAEARAKLTPKARDGNRAAAQHLSDVKTQQRALSTRRDNAITVMRREPELIIPGSVDFLAHALVVPSTDPADKECLTEDTERVAMELTKAYEEAAGAIVRYVHTPALARAAGLPDHPGFDILSERKSERRCIEVKGLAGTGEVEVTDNEWSRACNLGKEYWLYVVYHCATPTPQLVRVQDPFHNLLAKSFTRTQTSERTVQTTTEVGGVRIGQAQIMKVGEI